MSEWLATAGLDRNESPYRLNDRSFVFGCYQNIRVLESRDAQIKINIPAAGTMSLHAISWNSGRIFGLSWDLTRPVGEGGCLRGQLQGKISPASTRR
jgi:hypothetical protein